MEWILVVRNDFVVGNVGTFTATGAGNPFANVGDGISPVIGRVDKFGNRRPLRYGPVNNLVGDDYDVYFGSSGHIPIGELANGQVTRGLPNSGFTPLPGWGTRYTLANPLIGEAQTIGITAAPGDPSRATPRVGIVWTNHRQAYQPPIWCPEPLPTTFYYAFDNALQSGDVKNWIALGERNAPTLRQENVANASPATDGLWIAHTPGLPYPYTGIGAHDILFPEWVPPVKQGRTYTALPSLAVNMTGPFLQRDNVEIDGKTFATLKSASQNDRMLTELRTRFWRVQGPPR